MRIESILSLPPIRFCSSASAGSAKAAAFTIGIRGPDAQGRVDQLRHALDKLIAKHGWTTRNEPR